MASQARNQQLASLEPVEELGERNVKEMASEPLEPSMGPPKTAETQVPSLTTQVSSRELQAVLAALARQSSNCSQKKFCMIKKPDPFSGGGPRRVMSICVLMQDLLLYLQKRV